ncbi:MAG: site-specific integrase [Rhodoferax sp.]|nr:site-specific integrase [Rhodoferax sp.]
MATITNRSNFVVTVTKHDELEKSFPYDAHDKLKAYVKSLREQGFKPKLVQLATSFLVRVRRTGYPDQSITFGSREEAEAFDARVKADQHQGLFIDYAVANRVTVADIIGKYMVEDCPGLKGGDNYRIILNAMLQDSTNELRKRIDKRQQEMRELGRTLTPLDANRMPMTSLEWLQLPLTQVNAAQINDFVQDRLEYVGASTVARQLDLLRSIFNRAMNGWGYHLKCSPMQGVKYPAFFNERDRRLQDGEEVRLLDAARREDQLRSFERHADALAADEVKAALALPTPYAQNEARKAALDKGRRRALNEGYAHIPFYETFLQFQLATAARRGETLGLTWDRLDWKKQTAHVPTSKNGRPRHLSIRRDILALLGQLPRSSDLVFDIGIKELLNAWKRICEQAGVEGLHIHDCRHEGISRAAESGLFPTVLDLQGYSGHRDLRSLSRYVHLSPTTRAKRLEAAEEQRLDELGHNGRQRLKTTEMLRLGGAAEAQASTVPPELIAASGNVIPLVRRTPV